jgi:hypothetical protein
LLSSAGCADAGREFGEAENVGIASQALNAAEIWGFESASGWTITAGSANKQSSTVHDQGSFSLQLTAPGFVAVRADAVSKPEAVSPLLAVDIMVPPQAGPYYLGAVQMSLNAPSLNIYSAWVNQRELSVPTGVWQTLTFQIPSNVYNSLLASPFTDLSVTLGLNSPAGLNQPFRFDNLRFLPAPGCVGQPDGTLCDDSAACTTGNACAAGVCGTVATPAAGSACDPGDDVLGFENFSAWQSTAGSASLAPSTTRVQGARSLSVTTPNTSTVTSINLATLHKVSSTLSLRVQKPVNQPNQWWHGDLTLSMAVPSLGINLSQNKPLLGQPSGSFFELTFDVPPATVTALAGGTYTDLKFSIAINPPNGQVGAYLLDDLHFVPVASCTGAADKTACEDGSACSQGDSCQGGMCGAPVVCNDGNVCTVDVCVGTTGCQFLNTSALCSDGNACTGVTPLGEDSCSAGSCVSGPPVRCDDHTGCTTDSCDPATGCVNTYACSKSQVCYQEACCSPRTCLQLRAECGVHDDGCGGTVDCSSLCPSGGSCNPSFQCLPPNDFEHKTGINICEELIEDLHIPEVSHSVFECGDYDFFECAAFATAGRPCCVPILCLADPICTVGSIVIDVAEAFYSAGDTYCAVRSPKEYLEKILNGSISDLEQFGAMWTTGGLSLLFDFDIELMKRAGRKAPASTRTLIRALTDAVYDGGATGFAYEDLDEVTIVSSDFPTAGVYLKDNANAITMGDVIIMKATFYDALFGSQSDTSYAEFLTDTTVCPLYIGAVNTFMHELVHVKQYRELGRYNFTTQYVASAIVNGYGGNGFEQEAFEYTIMLDEQQGGNYCSVMAFTDNANIVNLGLASAPNTCQDTTGTNSHDFPACP